MCEATDTLKEPRAVVPSFSGGLESLQVTLKNSDAGDFTVGPAVETPYSQCRGPGFDPSSGNQSLQVPTEDPASPNEDPTCGNEDQAEQKKKRRKMLMPDP